jgi:L-lactate dehydrogenase (cytochrome)
VKGVQNLEDSKRLADLGVDGILLSNHGGRQLDRAPIPFHLLPEVAREVGNDTEVMVDTGIMNGADIVASLALGARFTLVGRAYLYGLMAGGRQGVDRTIQILADQVVRTMKLLEVASIEELTPRHVTQLQRLVPRAIHPAAVDAATIPARTARAPRPKTPATPAVKAAAADLG